MKYFLFVFILGFCLFLEKGNAQFTPLQPIPDTIQNNAALLAKHLTKNTTTDDEKARLL